MDEENKATAPDPGEQTEASGEEGARAPSMVSEIVLSMSVLMVAAIVLIALLISGIDVYLPPGRTEVGNLIILPYVVLFALTVTVFGWRLIARVVVRPLREILEATERVAAGDLTHRLRTAHSLEMAQLARAFNRMTSRLAKSRAELEGKVEELRRANLSLERTQLELLSSEKLAVVGRLAAGVAHEIGNPLSAIAGYLGIIQRRDYLQPGDREMLERVEAEVRRINGIIRELLDYSRPQNQPPGLIDLNGCVESTLTLMAGQKGFGNIEVQKSLSPLPPLRANRGAAQQLIMNLVLNAAQAMPEGGKLALSTAPASREGKAGMELTITDTGHGIAREDLPRIFDPFFTTKDPGQGTGLGLSICLRIVENMDGKIAAESEPGQGASFTVWLPAAGHNSEAAEN